MLFTVLNHTHTPSVSASSHHHNVTHVKLDELNNLVLLKVQLDGVIWLDERVRVTDGATIISVQVWNSLLTKLDRSNLAKLELCFLILDGVETETSLGVVEKTEVLIGLGDGYNIHETSRVSLVSPDFAINLDMPLHQDRDNFTVSQSILQPVPDDQDKRKTLPRLVRSRRWFGSPQQETA